MPVRLLRRGPISAYDYRCDVKPGDKPFPEWHASMSISYVRAGSFGYRARGKAYDLVAGSVLVGNAGDEFICTHEYAHGDQCLSFHIDRVIAEEIAPPAFWRTACLPPLSETAVIGELAQAAAERRSSIGLDEAALLLLHRAEAAVTRKRRGLRVSERGRRRAIEAAAWIEVHCDEGIGLQAAAATCGLSAYHFLRLFTRVIGVTPHQYLIRCRIRRAAHELSVSERPVTDVAFSCGFNDLPNFTRAFRRAAETSPSAYRNFCKA